jgi:hypothetical protein
MRDETKRRLERKLFLQRLKWVGGGVGVILFVGLGLWLTGLDASVEKRRIPGVVQSVGPLNGTSTRSIEEGLAVDVKLDDGRLAHVMALKTTDPHVGDHVQITEHIHGTGRVTFSWR